MKFGSQIKQIRKKYQYTQEDLAKVLNVSRQTISSWENDRNLPDLEMVVAIAKRFNLSLDQLILGDDGMEEKLINDSHEGNRARNYIIAGGLFASGAISLVIKAIIGTKVLSDGTLQEPFFLLPLGYLLMLIGLCYSMVLGMLGYLKKRKKA